MRLDLPIESDAHRAGVGTAYNHSFGVTNLWRSLGLKGSKLLSSDSASPFSPWLFTPLHPGRLHLSYRISRELRQEHHDQWSST